MESLESGYMGNHDIRRRAKIESEYGLKSGDTYILSAPVTTNRLSKTPEVKWKFEEIYPSSDRHTASAQSTPPRSQTLRAPITYSPEEEDEIGLAIGGQPAVQTGGITHTVEYSVRSEPRAS